MGMFGGGFKAMVDRTAEKKPEKIISTNVFSGYAFFMLTIINR